MCAVASRVVAKRKNPVVLSYKALRKAVGIVAIGLPIVLVIAYRLGPEAIVQGSISAYYFTGLRNVFVGSLCALAMFMLCTRGYDKLDEYAGILSALCALGVAFCPMDPKKVPIKLLCVCQPITPPKLHFLFAGALFFILGFFCLYLFRITCPTPTRKKLQRNVIYKVCGWSIYGGMFAEVLSGMAVDHGVVKLDSWFGGHHLLVWEVVCLWAFGVAWLVKGEAFLKDEPESFTQSATTDSLMP